MQTLLQRKASSITHSECVSVALGVQHVKRMRLFVICGLPCSTVFFQLISQSARIWKEKVTEHKMCVLVFSTILSETFLILRRNERDVI